MIRAFDARWASEETEHTSLLEMDEDPCPQTLQPLGKNVLGKTDNQPVTAYSNKCDSVLARLGFDSHEEQRVARAPVDY